MEDIEITWYVRPIWDKNRFETGYSKSYEELYLDVMQWGCYVFENHPMVEVELAGKICEGMTLMERLRKYNDWNKLSLNGFLYSCNAYEIVMNNSFDSLNGALERNYWIHHYEADQKDVKEGSWSHGFLEQNMLLGNVVDSLKVAHQGIIEIFQKLVESMMYLLDEQYRGMRETVDWKRMMNEQYRHYYQMEGRGKIQKLNVELDMMGEEERKRCVNNRMVEVMNRIGKSRLGEVHNRCCDIFGRNWDGARFVEEYKKLKEWNFEEILDYMVDITEWRFLNCMLEGRTFDDNENFVVEKNGETAEIVVDKGCEENGEMAVAVADKGCGENGEMVEARVEEDLGRVFGELMMNLEGYMKRPYRAKEVAEVVKRELLKGGETELGGELVSLLQAKRKEHRVGRMSVNHFFRLIELLKENGMIDCYGKPVIELIKDGLGAHWIDKFDTIFNKCLSTSWDKFRGKHYPHIGLNLIDELKRGK